MRTGKSFIVKTAIMSLSLSCAVSSVMAEPIRMRISVDSPAGHIKTIVMGEYVAAIKAKAGDKLAIELFHSGQLFNDRDVSKAIRQGAVEMAAPGTWLLGGVEPNFNFTGLPVTYGMDLSRLRAITDGEIGQELNKSLEAKLNAKVLGPWLEMGSAHWYTVNKPLNRYEDLKGLTIRTPGGATNELRLKFFNTNPVTIAYPDLAMALSQKKADGMISAPDSMVSTKMWEAGVKYSFADDQLPAHYVPLVSLAFWEKLPQELKNILTDTWRDQVPAQRAAMRKADAKARETLLANGVKIVDADEKSRTEARNRMMQNYDEWVKAAKVDAEFARRLKIALP